MKSLLVLVFIAAIVIILLSRFTDIDQFIGNFSGEYDEVSISRLFSYSNLHDGNKICTEGYHIKQQGYDVLKISPTGSIVSNAAIVNYAEGSEARFGSLVKSNQSALVRVCGLFESERGLIQASLGVFNHSITIEEYGLLESPVPY